MPSARNNTLATLKQETNSIDQIVQNYKGKKVAPDERKLIADLDTAWAEMQRGYKEIMKVADGGKNDEVSRLLADGSYLSKARKNTLAAVRNLNDYTTRPERSSHQGKRRGQQEAGRVYFGCCWLLGYSLNRDGDNYYPVDHQPAEEGCSDDGGIC